MANLRIKIGEKINLLTFIEYLGKTDKHHHVGKFICDCGSEKVTMVNRVFTNGVKSCGCLQRKAASMLAKKFDNTTHGLTTTSNESRRIYSVYRTMLDRCYNSNAKNYIYYGARGITVCDEWKNNPTAYYNWCIDNGYKARLHIDRIDNNGNYSPENCRVVTSNDNNRNTSRNRFVEFRGKTMVVKDFADLLGMAQSTMRAKLFKQGLTPEEVYNNPAKIYNRCKTLT